MTNSKWKGWETLVSMFPFHEEELTHNTAKLLQVNKKHPVAKIKAVGNGSHSSICDSEHGGGLLPTVFISKDAQVMFIQCE